MYAILMVYTKYTKPLLEDAVANSKSWRGVCRYLGLKIAGGTQHHLKKRCKDYGIDHSHFTGQAHNKGKRFGPKRPIEEYLKKDSPTSSHRLKLRLISEGLKEHKCEVCLGTEWMGKPVPIELDHIDGDHENNELSNLRIICPNCHAQTDTHAGKNIGAGMR